MQRGDQLRPFRVARVDGRPFNYSDIWQQKILVIVTVPAGATPSADYTAALTARAADFAHYNAECVITHEALPDFTSPAVLVADRWGEVIHLASPTAVSDLPPPDDILDWVGYVQIRCPECEGEWR